ncbi:MAG: hypothetical protein KF819_33610 [Labilithrix sp.]|nr:hypothetical protein [Labilithrix sp.]
MKTSRSVVVSALLTLTTAMACSVVVGEDPVQCSTDADCARRGPDFEGSVCGANGTCQPAPAPPPECTKSSECAGRGPDQICSPRLQKCMAATSEDCTVAYGNPSEDGAVIFGLLSEIGHGDTLYFRQSQHLLGAQLAFREFFDRNAVRLPGNRPAALLSCSEYRPRRAAAHLANVGVRAVIGPAEESRQRAVLETLAEAGVPSFTSWMNGNPSGVVAESAGLAWITSFLRPEVVDPLNAVVAEQEARIKATGVTNVRVAVVINTPTTASYNPWREYGDLMDQRLRFNGKTAIENEKDPGCGNCYKRFETSQALPDVVAARAKAIADFGPHIVIPFADIDWGAQLLLAIENEYQGKPPAVARPVYVQAFTQNEDQGYKALSYGDPAVRQRITGVRPVRDNSFELFQNKFRESFRPKSFPDRLGPVPNRGAGGAFETSLLVLFAAYAAMVDDPSIEPKDLIAALQVVADPTAPKITLNDIPVGIQRLNAKERIKLNGLFTFFDFDFASSTAKPTWATWCLSEAGQYVSSARIFSNGTFGPAEPCP